MKKFKFAFLMSIVFTASSFLFAEKPVVQDIQAVAGKGSKINVLWNLPSKPDKEITKLLVYRDTSPISSFQQLNKLQPIAEILPILTSYTDTVSDYKDYFYAVIAVTDVPYDLILISINSTNKGAHLSVQQKTNNEQIAEIEEKTYPAGSLREVPLPYLDYIEGFEKTSTISQETADSVKHLGIKSTQKPEKLPVYVFEEDLISPDGGDDFLLFEILKTTFIQKKYSEAIDDLIKLTGTNISSTTRNRAYFYLGESQYMLGQYQNGIKTFVRIEGVYPELAKKWIDNSLDQLN